MSKGSYTVADQKIRAFETEAGILKAVLPTILENQTIYAQIAKAELDALIEAGFTREEAIQLCK